MSSRPIDLQRARAGLARLQALVDTYPELRAPEAQARLTAWLAQEPHTMTKGKPKGDIKARARVQRLRQRRKEQGWQPYELWLPPDTAALLAQLKAPGEALHDTIGRALAALAAQGAMPTPAPRVGGTLSHDARRAALLQRMHAMREQGLSYLKIANQLNTEGEPTLNHRGSWKAGTVYNLLQESA